MNDKIAKQSIEVKPIKYHINSNDKIEFNENKSLQNCMSLNKSDNDRKNGSIFSDFSSKYNTPSLSENNRLKINDLKFNTSFKKSYSTFFVKNNLLKYENNHHLNNVHNVQNKIFSIKNDSKKEDKFNFNKVLKQNNEDNQLYASNNENKNNTVFKLGNRNYFTLKKFSAFNLKKINRKNIKPEERKGIGAVPKLNNIANYSLKERMLKLKTLISSNKKHQSQYFSLIDLSVLAEKFKLNQKYNLFGNKQNLAKTVNCFYKPNINKI